MLKYVILSLNNPWEANLLDEFGKASNEVPRKLLHNNKRHKVIQVFIFQSHVLVFLGYLLHQVKKGLELNALGCLYI